MSLSSTSLFYYPGDSGKGRIADYLEDRLRAIQLCSDQGEPEACLTLIYSGIDTLGFLAAPPEATQASRKTFIGWAETYLEGLVTDVNGGPVFAMDLYAARCGILHTSTPESVLGNSGDAHEIFYRYRGRHGFRLILSVPLPPIVVEIEHLSSAFTEGALSFARDLGSDFDRAQFAYSRAEGFMRWGVSAE